MMQMALSHLILLLFFPAAARTIFDAARDNPNLECSDSAETQHKREEKPEHDQWRGYLVFVACRQPWPTEDRHAVIILQQQCQKKNGSAFHRFLFGKM
jgi:hypothetical protein